MSNSGLDKDYLHRILQDNALDICLYNTVHAMITARTLVLEHSDSAKNIPIRFDFPKRIDFFDFIRFSTSLPCRRIYRLLSLTVVKCQYFPVYYIGTDLLSTVSYHTYLGITVSSDLN